MLAWGERKHHMNHMCHGPSTSYVVILWMVTPHLVGNPYNVHINSYNFGLSLPSRIPNSYANNGTFRSYPSNLTRDSSPTKPEKQTANFLSKIKPWHPSFSSWWLNQPN